ncbi:MAG: alkaline phosphatase [Flavobacteriaceae bacterium]
MKTAHFLLFIFHVFLASVVVKAQTEKPLKKPKNIVLLIGDGTGLSQVSAAQFYKDGPSNYDRFPVVGLIKTSSSSDLITDSAAGATAFASGIKTYNAAIGVDKDTIEAKTMVEIVSQKGMNTGLIATSSITHATPACFYAHVPNRNNHEDIAAFLPTSEVDFFAGAGLQYFNQRKDGKDLLGDFQKNGFVIDTVALSQQKGKKIGFLLAEKSMPKMLEGRGDFLPNATKLAMEFLSKGNKNFFLMVEGSQIDWGGHDNDSEYLISELIDFDNTLGVALDFAKKNEETLVIVSADHETGGFTLGSQRGNYNEIKPTFSTDGHSATMVPVFAYGPGAELFGGIYENTQIFHKILSLLSE